MANSNLSPYQFSYEHSGGLASVEVHLKGRKKEGIVGQLYWNTDPKFSEKVGHITSVAVHPEHQRKGLATEMYSRGQKFAGRTGIPAPNTQVTRHYTKEGSRWRNFIEAQNV